MATLYLWEEKLLLVDELLAADESCCCGSAGSASSGEQECDCEGYEPWPGEGAMGTICDGEAAAYVTPNHVSPADAMADCAENCDEGECAYIFCNAINEGGGFVVCYFRGVCCPA